MFARKDKDYEVKTNVDQPEKFTVIINHSILYPGIEDYMKKSQDGFTFTPIDYNTIELNITPTLPIDKVDSLFRGAVSLLNKNKLVTKEYCEIITAYETHLRRHGFESTNTVKKSPYSNGGRPGAGSAY